MSEQHAFSECSINALNERTAYEVFLLEAIYSIAEQELFPSWPDGVIYPLHALKPQFFYFASGKMVIGDWRPGFLNAGAPLVFISTFKLLDMIIEWTLEENKIQSNYRFQQKLKQLDNGPIFPAIIETRAWLKDRLIGFYKILEPLRGTIIHQKHFNTTDGAMRVASSKFGTVGEYFEISSVHLRKLALTIITVLKYIQGAWLLDDFREKKLRHDLDELVLLHGCGALDQKYPEHTCVRVYTTSLDPRMIDIKSIQTDLATRFVDIDYSFDIRVLVVEDCQVVEAYLFPWSVLKDLNNCWNHTIKVEEYKTLIPEDIKLEHLKVSTL